MNLRERRFDRRARKFADITHRGRAASRARRRESLDVEQLSNSRFFFNSRAIASNLRRDRSPRRRPPRGGYAARPSRASLGDASSTARVARDVATSRMRRATLDRARRALASRAPMETALEDAKSMIEYARARWRVGARGDARGVLEHASVALRRRGEEPATSSAIARARTAWAHLARERGERGTADDDRHAEAACGNRQRQHQCARQHGAPSSRWRELPADSPASSSAFISEITTDRTKHTRPGSQKRSTGPDSQKRVLHKRSAEPALHYAYGRIARF